MGHTPKADDNTRERDLLAGVAKLREYDHAFLSVEGANHFGEIFGVPIRCYVAKAEPHLPKGLTLKNGAKSAKGIDAQDLAMQICDSLRVTYSEMFGRGSQLHTCCDALEHHFKTQRAADDAARKVRELRDARRS